MPPKIIHRGHSTMLTTLEKTNSGDGQIPAAAILQGHIYLDDPGMHAYDFQEENSGIQPVGWDVKERSAWLDNALATILENDSRGFHLQMQQEVCAPDPTQCIEALRPECFKVETGTKSAMPEAALEGGVVTDLVHPTVDTTQYYRKPSDCQDVDLGEKQTSYMQEEDGNVLPVGWDANKTFFQNMQDDEQEQGFPMQHEVSVEDSTKSALEGGPCSEMNMETEPKFSMPETSLDKGVNNLIEEIKENVDATNYYEEQDAELPDELQPWEDDWILKYPSHSQNESTLEATAASDVAQILGHHEANVERSNDQDIAPQAVQQQWDRLMAGSNIQVGSTLPRNSSYRRPHSHKPEQLLKLRNHFQRISKYIEYDEALTLSNKTKMSVQQIQTFFSNERNRQKRMGNTEGLKKKNQHSESQMAVLEAWVASHSGNLSPTTREKDKIAQKAGLSLDQVSTWFENRRKRQKKDALREGG